jgi:L-alanine-DL-glutamate epimerase-like enolase superfamily enzyme
MVRRVHASGKGADLALMLDVEQRYEAPDALRVGRELGELGYTWLEAPLDDFDLHGYRRLARELAVDIVPAGNSLVDHRLVKFGLDSGCWDRVRIDVMTCGGLTGALKIMGLAAAHGTTVELQCWGYTLGQAANLHLMLGQPNCTYFEQPTPYEAFEYGSETVIRTDGEGFVHAPAGIGLGIEVNWAEMERATLGRLDCTAAAA